VWHAVHAEAPCVTTVEEQRGGSRRRALPGARRPQSVARLSPTHPAWGVAFIGSAGALMFVSALTLVALRDGGSPTLLLSGAGAVLGALVFDVLVVRWAHAWRPWLTSAAMLVGELNILLFVVIAPDPESALAGAATFTWAAVFAGLYLRPGLVVAHVAVQGVLMAVGLAEAGGPETATTAMALLFPVCCGLAFLTSSLAVRLRQQSDHDALTGLLNRRGLYDRADRLRRTATATPWAVAVLDLDGFKGVNDRQGHEAGDRLLSACGVAWAALLPPAAVLARTGGDEFVLVHPGGVEELHAVVDRVRAATPPPVGMSAGVAPWPADSELDEALRFADAALYEAKQFRGSTRSHG